MDADPAVAAIRKRRKVFTNITLERKNSNFHDSLPVLTSRVQPVDVEPEYLQR